MISFSSRKFARASGEIRGLIIFLGFYILGNFVGIFQGKDNKANMVKKSVNRGFAVLTFKVN
ncbi:hypothetical protein ES703_56985 [subsurface metagenome]